ncbi:unnamed protein product [Pleuronectes platessa]|uniref:Uncharacterized protein n=1 Tax=Pleuronectes platessa TaxID=8262 RepID=A0A9N7V814_PLEPL|nr:unnamed protein product [Pleuronectes platessa]
MPRLVEVHASPVRSRLQKVLDGKFSLSLSPSSQHHSVRAALTGPDVRYIESIELHISLSSSSSFTSSCKTHLWGFDGVKMVQAFQGVDARSCIEASFGEINSVQLTVIVRTTGTLRGLGVYAEEKKVQAVGAQQRSSPGTSEGPERSVSSVSGEQQ